MGFELNGIGRNLIIIGIFLVIIGVLFGLDLKIPLGRLPGDIRIERENFKFYFPITTSILISIILSLLMKLFK
ncbi:MAG: hypothetical protein AWU54_2109 [Candidatus Frackibacter sp. T328-2]|nr:MAG: hypothetical protein AWU54_2109 [Candidatus Frackibacter sp. T328-2]